MIVPSIDCRRNSFRRPASASAVIAMTGRSVVNDGAVDQWW